MNTTSGVREGAKVLVPLSEDKRYCLKCGDSVPVKIITKRGILVAVCPKCGAVLDNDYAKNKKRFLD